MLISNITLRIVRLPVVLLGLLVLELTDRPLYSLLITSLLRQFMNIVPIRYKLHIIYSTYFTQFSVGCMDVNTVNGSTIGVDTSSKAVGVDELLLAVMQKSAAHDRKFDSSVQWRLVGTWRSG